MANAIGLIMSAQARFGSPLRRTAVSIEYRLFTAITNHQFLLDMFRHRPERILIAFEENEVSYRNDFHFWLQRALFEFESRRDLRQDALDHIRIAINIAPTSFQVVNAYSKMHLQMAVAAESEEEALLLMQQASETLERQMANSITEPYALTVLAIGRLKVFKRWFPAELHKEAVEMVARLRDAQKRYRYDPEIEDAIRQASLISVETVETH